MLDAPKAPNALDGGAGSRNDVYAGFDDISVNGDWTGDMKSPDCEVSQSGDEYPSMKS